MNIEVICPHCGYVIKFNPNLKLSLNTEFCRLVVNNGNINCVKCSHDFQIDVTSLLEGLSSA